MLQQGKVHNNAHALSHLTYTDCESDICSNSVVSIVAHNITFACYSPQDIQTKQLEDNLVRPFQRAKETSNQPLATQKGPKWCKMVQLWTQLFVKNRVLYRLFSGSESSSSMM